MTWFDAPDELCIACGDEAEFRLPAGSVDGHVCPLRHVPNPPGPEQP